MLLYIAESVTSPHNLFNLFSSLLLECSLPLYLPLCFAILPVAFLQFATLQLNNTVKIDLPSKLIQISTTLSYTFFLRQQLFTNIQLKMTGEEDKKQHFDASGASAVDDKTATAILRRKKKITPWSLMMQQTMTIQLLPCHPIQWSCCNCFVVIQSWLRVKEKGYSIDCSCG